MWFPAHPKTRTVSSLMVRLGVMVPALVAPAVAQDAPPAIVATPSGAGRGEREKLAPAAIAQAEAALQAAQAADSAAFEETVKRLRDVEASDPARALAEYRRFLVGRNPSPVLGVQVALKVAQMRQKIGDFQGALLTCDVLSRKYAAEPTAVLLSLQKARVLMAQKKLAQASGCVDEALPNLMALGPQHYDEVSGFLRQLAQVNLDIGQYEGKERARTLYIDVEEIYLRWMRGGTTPHTWQMFDALQVKYRQVGDEKRASELLPKAVDALLQMKATSSNPEGADVSVMAARWLLDNGNTQAAQELYAKAPAYGNSFVSQVALTDQGQQLIAKGLPQAALDLMAKNSPKELEFGPQWVVALAYWQLEDWPKAEEALSKIVHADGPDTLRGSALSRLTMLQQWKSKTFSLPLCKLIVHPDENRVYHATLYVHSLRAQSIEVLFSDPTVHLNALTLRQQQRMESGVLVAVYDLSYSTSRSTNPVEAFVQLKNQPAMAQRIELQERQEQKDA